MDHKGALGSTILDRRRALAIAAAAMAMARPAPSLAATASELDQESRLALDRLFALQPKTREWARDARAILIFPSIKKAGLLMVGGQTGEGALLVQGRPIGFFRITAGSVGMQHGVQSFSYAMFFLTQKALDYAKSSEGWAFGSGPSVVLVDEGMAKNTNTSTLRKDVLAVVFGQKGLMAGLGLEGSKITRIYPDA